VFRLLAKRKKFKIKNKKEKRKLELNFVKTFFSREKIKNASTNENSTKLKEC
jgi:hypothetical protein